MPLVTITDFSYCTDSNYRSQEIYRGRNTQTMPDWVNIPSTTLVSCPVNPHSTQNVERIIQGASENTHLYQPYLRTDLGSEYTEGFRLYYNDTILAGNVADYTRSMKEHIGVVVDDDTRDAWILSTEQWGDAVVYLTHYIVDGKNYCYNAIFGEPKTANGGGATHIAKVTGQLKDLSSSLSDILLVSGGGGGGLLVGEDAYAGKEAGGISGSGDNSADQSTGYAFGQGESGTNVSGGGGGYYGGEKGGSLLSGGAGSGYIGNSLVSNKKMVGYNVPTSSAEATKTESVSVYSATKEANKPKAGNGFARIKFIPTYQEYSLEELIKTSDLTHYKETWVGNYSVDDNWSTLSQWLNTDWNLTSQNGLGTYNLLKQNDEYVLGSSSNGGMSLYALPLKNNIKVKQIKYDGKFSNQTGNSSTQHHLRLGYAENGSHSIVSALTVAQGGSSADYIVNDTDYHTFTEVMSEVVECNYIEFYVGDYTSYFKNIKVLIEV